MKIGNYLKEEIITGKDNFADFLCYEGSLL